MTTKVYRGKNEIIARMLQTIRDSDSEGASRTTIMYKSFLSYAQLKEYVSFLVEKGLIEELPRKIRNSDKEKLVYKITEKGLHFLWICQEIESLINLD